MKVTACFFALAAALAVGTMEAQTAATPADKTIAKPSSRAEAIQCPAGRPKESPELGDGTRGQQTGTFPETLISDSSFSSGCDDPRKSGNSGVLKSFPPNHRAPS